MKVHNKIKSSVNVKLHNDGTHWTLLSDLKVIINNIYIVVPKGFTTDFATIPKYLKPFVPNKFIYNQIVVVHDYLYSMKIVSRKTADEILRDGLLLLSNNPTIIDISYSKIFYISVRTFGGSHWNNS